MNTPDRSRSTLNDCYHVTGKDFPMPENSDKGVDSGLQDFAGTSDRQLSPRLNASKPGDSNSKWGEEGRQFPTDANGQESTDEDQTFAGQRDTSVAVSLVSGQITSDARDRYVPVPLSDDGDSAIRARMKFKKTRADIKENKI